MTTPTVGRIVHYVTRGEHGTGCHAAIVTHVCDNPDPETGAPCVSLAVLTPQVLTFQTHVPQSEHQHHTDTWHWPERT